MIEQFKLVTKIKEWEEWCKDKNSMNDNIKEFFEDLSKKELFLLLETIKYQQVIDDEYSELEDKMPYGEPDK